MAYRRYAIYFTPADGPLADFGAAWLGWDSANGSRVAQPGLLPDEAQITQTPRKYGFHATLKPPMRLASGKTATDLEEATQHLANTLVPAASTGLRLARLGRFLALVPDGSTEALARLAGRVVAELDAFRAPADEAELAKRRKNGLSPAQEANLVTWGYPYVFSEFRFHMTLSGSLDAETLNRTEAALEPALAGLLPHPFVIDALTLLGEAEDGMFHVIHRYALSS